jgi:L,D-transpeptidase ErfK/SrfK
MRTVASFAFAFSVLTVAAPAMAQQPVGDLIGSTPTTTYTVVKGDTLADIAREHRIGLVELLAANPAVTSNTISIDQTLTIPTQRLLPSGERKGIIVNLAALRLFRFDGSGNVETYPVSVGREGWDTPTGTTTIVRKREDPEWTVPASIRAEDPSLPKVVPAGPKNPLGEYALTLGWDGYLIHGTNAPSSIGKPSSHGCMRLYPEDIQALYSVASVGDAVTVVENPITLGQSAGQLYLQVTPTRTQAKQIASYEPVTPLSASDGAVRALEVRLADLEARGLQVNMQAVQAAIQRHDGIPVAIARIPENGLVASQASATHTSVQDRNWLDAVVEVFIRVIDGISAAITKIRTA